MKNTLFVCGVKQLTQLFVLLLSFLATPSYAIETITYYHTDSLGSPVAGTDTSGALLWKEDYKPYGERIRKQVESDKNTRWYTGHPEDKETGLTYAGARFYDSVTGQFLAVDSVGFKEDNLHTFNRYAYANNNPYIFIDPDGRETLSIGANLRIPGWLTWALKQSGVIDKEGGQGGEAGIAISTPNFVVNSKTGKTELDGIYDIGFYVEGHAGGMDLGTGRFTIGFKSNSKKSLDENDDYAGYGVHFGPGVNAGISGTDTKVWSVRGKQE